MLFLLKPIREERRMKDADKRRSPESMPQTGRIGRFAKILKSGVDADAYAEILKDANQYGAFAAEQKSAWWKRASEGLELRYGREKAIVIMRKCGAKCCGKGQRDTARRLFEESHNLADFLNRIGRYDVKEGNLTYTLEDEHTIVAEHHRCFCHQVAGTERPFASLVYCHCSVEFNRQFFSAALGRDVCVELLQSIICGANSCMFRITI
jgi:hypothetical protein